MIDATKATQPAQPTASARQRVVACWDDHVARWPSPNDLANNLRLPLIDTLGNGGRGYGSSVPSRAVRVHALPSGQQLVIEWHQGSATPPNAAEVAALKAALTGRT